MRFGIVEPVDYTDRGNPGWHMINAGIRHLLRRACPAAEFVSLPMLSPWTRDEQSSAGTCDVLVLAGNPRYDLGTHEWLYTGVMDQMLATGRPLIDAWQGAAVVAGNGIEHDASCLLHHDRNAAILDRLTRFDAVITRDSLAQRVNELAGIRSVQLPCSSWWAAHEYGIEPSCARGAQSVLIPRCLPQLDEIVRELSHWRVVATTRADWEHCRDIGVPAELIWHPRSLLMLFSGSETVVSCRLHAAIPAASLGCRTAMIATDSRPQACDAFGIPWASPVFAPRPASAAAISDPTDTITQLIEGLA